MKNEKDVEVIHCVRNSTCIIWLILFFPVGLYLMWKRTPWNKNIKWVITGFFALFVFMVLVTDDPKEDSIVESGATTSTTSEEVTEVLETTSVIVESIFEDTYAETELFIEDFSAEDTPEHIEQEVIIEQEDIEGIIDEFIIEDPGLQNQGGGGNGNNFNIYDNPEQQNTTEYVLNTSTKKFHSPSCSDVKKISPENYATNGDRSDTINSGYVPCKKCEP